jgi:hypothetical protein
MITSITVYTLVSDNDSGTSVSVYLKYEDAVKAFQTIWLDYKPDEEVKATVQAYIDSGSYALAYGTMQEDRISNSDEDYYCIEDHTLEVAQ